MAILKFKVKPVHGLETNKQKAFLFAIHNSLSLSLSLSLFLSGVSHPCINLVIRMEWSNKAQPQTEVNSLNYYSVIVPSPPPTVNMYTS